ncbi:hypothetical protein QQP08_010072 [Theobroma cacao]|nr:hypothetical protein QQP08_010072 [Theobroma cacao]
MSRRNSSFHAPYLLQISRFITDLKAKSSLISPTSILNRIGSRSLGTTTLETHMITRHDYRSRKRSRGGPSLRQIFSPSFTYFFVLPRSIWSNLESFDHCRVLVPCIIRVEQLVLRLETRQLLHSPSNILVDQQCPDIDYFTSLAHG